MKIQSFLTIFALLLLFSSCGEVSPPSVTRTEFALGTIITVRVDGLSESEADAAIDAAFERLGEIEAVASAKDPHSELSYINANAYESDVLLSAELFYLLKEGLYYSELTGGAFDITLGAIVELWGIGSENARVPDADEIAWAVESSGFEHLVLNEDERTVRFLKEGLWLDLGALAKGYAGDEMKRILRENGVKNAIIDLGGDIITIGDNGGKGWVIGLTDPLNTGEICAKLRIYDLTIVTSGNYERYFTHEGKRYHHIFDRRTGYPADSEVISATTVGVSAMMADALSTALFVKGEPIPGDVYILIDKDMNFTYSEDLNLEIIS